MCRKIYGKPLVCVFSFIMFLQAFFLFRNFTKFLCRSLSFTTFIVHAEIFLYLAKCPLKEWEGGLRLLTPCFFNFAEGGCDMTGDSGFLDVVPRDVELYGGSSSGSAVICDNGMSSYGLPINLHNGTGGMVMPESVSSNFDESVIVASPTSDSQQGASEATEGIDEDVQHQAIANPQPLPTTMDASAYDRFLHEAHLQNNRKCMPQLPWETGILAAIFGDEQSIHCRVPIPAVVPAPALGQSSRDDYQDVDMPSSASKRRCTTRSGRFVSVAEPTAGPDHDSEEVQVEPVHDELKTSGSSSAVEEELNQKFDKAATLDYEGPLYQHKKSRVLHKPHEQGGRLLCGRSIGVAYNFLSRGSTFKWARCSLCFKGDVVTSVDGLVEAFDAARAKRKDAGR